MKSLILLILQRKDVLADEGSYKRSPSCAQELTMTDMAILEQLDMWQRVYDIYLFSLDL